jgi:hypothetical protein
MPPTRIPLLEGCWPISRARKLRIEQKDGDRVYIRWTNMVVVSILAELSFQIAIDRPCLKFDRAF